MVGGLLVAFIFGSAGAVITTYARQLATPGIKAIWTFVGLLCFGATLLAIAFAISSAPVVAS